MPTKQQLEDEKQELRDRLQEIERELRIIKGHEKGYHDNHRVPECYLCHE